MIYSRIISSNWNSKSKSKMKNIFQKEIMQNLWLVLYVLSQAVEDKSVDRIEVNRVHSAEKLILLVKRQKVCL